MNSNGVVIFANVQMDEPQYLCVKENGELYTCTVEVLNENFIEKNVKIVTNQDAIHRTSRKRECSNG